MTDRVKIKIEPYDPRWQREFEIERGELRDLFAPVAFAIEHVGSTAVTGLAAKPIIDIMLGCDRLADFEAFIPTLEEAGWEYLARFEAAFPQRRFLVKPAAPPRRVHLHAVESASAFWKDHLLFRDRLRGNPGLAATYEALKFGLAEQFGDDREGYSEAKTDFVESVLRGA